MKLQKLLKDTEFILKKHGPEILVAVGIISGAAGTVVAIKETLTVKEELEPIKEEIEEIKSVEEVDKKALTKAYAKGALVLIKKYGVVLALEAGGVCCVVGGFGKLKKRHIQLAGAYTMLDATFKQYRQNVIDELGDEKDYDFYHGLKNEKIEVDETDPETGKKKKIKKSVKVKNGMSPYSVLFQPGNVNYTDCPSLNMSFLQGIELYINERCRNKGKIFLSDCYEQLGFEDEDLNPIQRLGARRIGYIWDDDNPSDHQISFHIFDSINARAVDDALHNNNNGEPVFIVDFDMVDILDEYAMGIESYE